MMAEPAVEVDDAGEELGEVQVAEYLMLLLAVDTFAGYVEEQTDSPANDDQTRKGIRLLRLADSQNGDALRDYFISKLTREESQRAVKRSFSLRVTNAEQAGRRAMTLKTALNRGGAATLKAVFDEARPRTAVKTSIAASMLDDAAAALDRYSALPIRNLRIKNWIKEAREVVGAGTSVHNPVESAAAAVLDHVQRLKDQKVAEEGTTGAEAVHNLQDARAGTIERLEVEATEAARAALDVSGMDDTPPTRSEVIGLATAVAAAAAADMSSSTNVPESLRRLDAEQQAAALTDGRVLVAAGAGSGKSTTLVARVKYLVDERKVNPARMIVSSFNKKAADELKTKIGKAIGGERAAEMNVGTLHGLFRDKIGKYGTQEEKGMFRGKDSILSGSAIASAVNRLWRKCHAQERSDGTMVDAESPNAKAMLMEKTKWSGNGITPAMAKAQARTVAEQQAALWYEMYEGLKGAIPGWKPLCEGRAEASREYDNFLRKNRLVRGKDGQEYYSRIGDFDDMCSVFASILERNPDVRRRAQKAFDHVMIDEAQDLNGVQSRILELLTEQVTDGSDGKSFWMVGDPDQCVSVDTLVSVSSTDAVKAGDLKEGDSVLAFRNGSLTQQRVRHRVPSQWNEGIRIRTESGKSLLMSPNHKIWAYVPPIDDGRHIVYLMYRSDMGYRVGITNKTQGETNRFGGRAWSERADRMWILDIVPDREAALLIEESYSLRYGIPTQVFNAASRGINQDRVDALFREFGARGEALTRDRHLSFDHPHWMACGQTREDCRSRRVVNLITHASGGSQVRLEWTGTQFDDSLREGDVRVNFQTTSRPNFRRVRKWFTNYREALTFAHILVEKTGSVLRERLAVDEDMWPLVTAGSLSAGMIVATLAGDGIEGETVVSVERGTPGKFADLDIDDASNFFGGGILSHNSIYAFRGARPELLVGLDGKEGWKTRLIRTNYRCPPEIVNIANRLVANNSERMDKDANAAPNRAAGEASITANVYAGEAETAIAVASEIKETWENKVGEISDNAILCRTNKELNSFETALLMRGIPYARKGASSFLSSPETKAFLGYVTLATDADTEKTQQALRDVLNKPNRFFVSAEQVDRAIDLALNSYGKRRGVAKKTIDPMAALRDTSFQEDLVSVLTGSSEGFKAKKAYQRLDDLIRAMDDLTLLIQSDDASTKEMFDAVLEMPGTKFKVDPVTGKILGEEPVSFRSELSAAVKDYGDEEEEAQDEERPDEMNLGNISFLYELAKTNPEDPGDVEIPPETPKGFWAKMGRLKDKAKEFRIDVTAWEKQQENLPPEDRKPPPGVFLGTAHATKGAQWPTVYVQMPKGKFPLERSNKDDEDDDSQTPERLAEKAAEIESERRLAYVALTRPSKNLRIVAPAKIQGKPAGRSQFWDEAGLVSGENVVPAGIPKTAAAFVEDYFGLSTREQSNARW
jgi:superfamily I DNA/RNA helicase